MQIESINDIAAYLDKMGLLYMATIGLDAKPKVRPVQYMVTSEEKLWFCTNSKKAMYEELCKNPFVDFCASRLEENEINTAWIRFSAQVVFEENIEVKRAIMKKSQIVRELYENNAEHPLFKVYYLKNIEGALNNLGHVKGLKEREEFSKPVSFSF